MQFLKFFGRKFFFWIISLFLIATLTFFLLKIIPGDPFNDAKELRKDMQEKILQHYGLDKPLITQYKIYLLSLLKGDFGYSLKYDNLSVNDVIRKYFPVSAYLGLQSLIVALVLSLFFGIICALKPDSWIDAFIQFGMALCISIPGFILASLLQYFFAIKWRLLPLAQWGTFSQTILPTITIAALPTAFITRLIRNNLLEVLESDYIKTAKAKGLSSFKILWKHALRNALLPVLSYLGPLTAGLLVGSFIVEKIFNIPGLGQWYVSSIANRDYALVMGLSLFYSLLLMGIIFIIDLTYSLLDPRIRMVGKN